MSLIKWFGPTNGLVLTPDSPRLTYNDRVRATDIYMGQQSVCAANMLPRGALGSGARVGWVVNQCTMETMRGGIGRLTYEWEAGGTSAIPLPSGSFSLKPQELYPKIERASCFNGITAATVNVVYNALQGVVDAAGNAHGGEALIYDNVTDPTQLTLALNLLAKLVKGEESFYLAGWRYVYEVFSYTVPTLSKGGTPGTPGGPLSENLPSNVAWLRLADDLDPAGVNGSLYRLTVSWLGGPIWGGVGYWDSDVYS